MIKNPVIAAAVLALLSGTSLFAGQVEVGLRCIFWKPELAQEKIYFKGAAGFYPVDSAIASFPLKAQKYRGGNPIAIFRKDEKGEFVQCAEVEIPTGTSEACVVFFSDKTLPEKHVSEFKPTLNVAAFDCSRRVGAGGQVVVANLAKSAFRVSAEGVPAVKVSPGETGVIFSLAKDAPAETLGVKIVSAAKTPEEAKKAWRYASAIIVVSGQCYFCIVGPAEKKDPAGLPRFEVISVRDERRS